jgi:hypothetical protein
VGPNAVGGVITIPRLRSSDNRQHSPELRRDHVVNQLTAPYSVVSNNNSRSREARPETRIGPRIHVEPFK